MSRRKKSDPATSSDRLVLGTVQLGMPYGIANKTGQPAQREANALVRAAWDRGVRYFDTAQGYGQSEAVLGKALGACSGFAAARVVSKLSPDLCEKDVEHLEQAVQRTLANLNLPSLYALMFHREEHLPLLDGPLGVAIGNMRDRGIFSAFGISVYSPAVAHKALEHELISIIQVPASIFDRRFERAGVFQAARDKGKDIHIRSALLQGVLCMPPALLPPCLSALGPALETYRAVCAAHAIGPAPLGIAWLLHHYPDTQVLFGAETAAQVIDSLDFSRLRDDHKQSLWADLEAILPPQVPELLNPSLWKTLP